jgi:hypothetical protein
MARVPYADSLLSPRNGRMLRPIAIPRTSAQRETEYFDGSSVVRRYQHNCARCRILSADRTPEKGNDVCAARPRSPRRSNARRGRRAQWRDHSG